MFEGSEPIDQGDFLHDPLVAASNGNADRVAGVTGPELASQSHDGGDRSAVDFDDPIIGLEPFFMGGRSRQHRGQGGGSDIRVARLETDAEDPRLEILTGLQLFQDMQDVGQGDGKPDPRVVPADAGQLLVALGRHQHAQHAAVDIGQRAAVV